MFSILFTILVVKNKADVGGMIITIFADIVFTAIVLGLVLPYIK